MGSEVKFRSSRQQRQENRPCKEPPAKPRRIELEIPSQEPSNNHFRKDSKADTEIHKSFYKVALPIDDLVDWIVEVLNSFKTWCNDVHGSFD